MAFLKVNILGGTSDEVKIKIDGLVFFHLKDGAILEAVYKNTKAKLVESNINLDYFLKKSNLVESYRVGTLNEYQQPFTLSHATITSYDAETNGYKIH